MVHDHFSHIATWPVLSPKHCRRPSSTIILNEKLEIQYPQKQNTTSEWQSRNGTPRCALGLVEANIHSTTFVGIH